MAFTAVTLRWALALPGFVAQATAIMALDALAHITFRAVLTAWLCWCPRVPPAAYLLPVHLFTDRGSSKLNQNHLFCFVLRVFVLKIINL